jgi:hypothetical protein
VIAFFGGSNRNRELAEYVALLEARVAELERERDEARRDSSRLMRERDDARQALEDNETESFSAAAPDGRALLENVSKIRAIAAARQVRGVVLDATGGEVWSHARHGGVRRARTPSHTPT